MAARPQDIQPPTHKVLYHIVKGQGRKNSWRKFGAGFVNGDGSLNIIIDLFPGQHFQLRDPNVPEPPPEPKATRRTGATKSRK
ncbi:MAG TPA: hypothetical protein VJ464_13335 [Blastocatellia bacterium]|nr:hypothetical protein [Blastocatellia bacterium]